MQFPPSIKVPYPATCGEQVGKTAFALHLARAAAMAGRHVVKLL